MALPSHILLMVQDLPHGQIIWAVSALLLVILVGLVIVTQVKKRIQQVDEPVSAGFTLSDLRRLHREGKMSNEEFEKAKARVIEAAKKAAERDAAKAAGKENLSDILRQRREQRAEPEEEGEGE